MDTATSPAGKLTMGRGGRRGFPAARRLMYRVFQVPLFYKVLVANSAIVVLGAVVGTLLTAMRLRAVPTEPRSVMIFFFVIAGIALSVLVNFIVLKAAFLPLISLEHTVEAVRRGDLRARALHVLFGDPQIDQLVDTMNRMLDELQRYREEVHLLSQQAITAQEEERKRIARELHDETAQSLTSLLIQIRLFDRARSPDELQERIAALREQIGQVLDGVRKLAVDLRPSTLDDLGLVPALQWYTGDFAERMGIRVSFHSDPNFTRLPDRIELIIYRVVQEALTNIAKHAEASQVQVDLVRTSSTVTAVVVDNGCGFEPQSVMGSRERGLGLFGMKERAALVGGHCEIESAPGAGTRIDVQVPLPS